LKSHLSRPLLAVAVGGSLLAGGTLVAGPAFAVPAPPPVTSAPDEPIVPGVPAPTETTDPGVTPTPTDPGTTPTTAPTTDPTAGPTTTTTTDPTTGPTTTPTTEPTPTTAPTTAPTTPADTTAPVGSFKVNASAFWIGQVVSLTQVGVADNGVADPATVTRVLTWGDGTSTTLRAGQGAVTKRFGKVGRFTTTLTLTDAAGNKTVKSSAITVTSPAKVKISKAAVWHGERFNVTFSSVPSGTTKIVLIYGDGSRYKLKPKNQTIPSVYDRRAGTQTTMPAGPVTLTAVYTNRLGDTSPIVIGRVTIRKDSWKPKVSISKPKRAERVSSWKTVRGTASDKGSGLQFVFVAPMRVTGNKLYCYTKGKTWIRVSNDAQLDRCGVYVRVVKGKWSLSLKGLKKGSFSVAAIAVDWADRTSSIAERSKKLTRS
jgi:hypothetical protein